MVLSLRHVLLAVFASAITVPAATEYIPKLSGADSVGGFSDLKPEVLTRQYIRNFNVSYSDNVDDMPKDAVQQIRNLEDVLALRDNNLNAGHRGPYIWLTRLYTTDPEAAATSLEFLYTKHRVPGLSDLAAGGHGRYRYLVPKANTSVRNKITKAVLFRPKRFQLELPYGYTLGPDLIRGRGGEHLYLLFHSEEVLEDEA